MFVKRKEKLNLINNYVDIHRCIFDCKYSIINENCNPKNLENLLKLTDQLIELKKQYEKIFNTEKMMDDSLILLKMQLESSIINYPKNIQKNINIDSLINTINRLKNSIKFNR